MLRIATVLDVRDYNEELGLPGEAAGDWIRMEEGADCVSHSYSYQLLTSIYLILILTSYKYNTGTSQI